MKRTIHGITLLLLTAVMAACAAGARTTTTSEPAGRRGIAEGDVKAITIYRSPTCSCCKEYEAYLAAAEYRVDVVEVADVSATKRELGIPESVWSCHSSKYGDYVLEGHVPIEALDKLVSEKPSIAGLALPGMPSGAPGMSGTKDAPLHVMSFDDSGTVAHYIAV